MTVKFRLIVGGLLLAALLPLHGSPPASANIRPNDCTYAGAATPCAANNKNHYFYRDSNLPTTWEVAVEATRTGTYSNVPGWNTFSTTSHASADVHFLRDDGIGSALIGQYSCSTILSNGRCDHAHIRFNHDYSQLTDGQKRSVACHETGHSLALTHPPDDDAAIYQCMVVDGFPIPLGAHNVWHLQTNPWWG